LPTKHLSVSTNQPLAQTLVKELLLTQCRMFWTASLLKSNLSHHIKPLYVALRLTQLSNFYVLSRPVVHPTAWNQQMYVPLRWSAPSKLRWRHFIPTLCQSLIYKDS